MRIIAIFDVQTEMDEKLTARFATNKAKRSAPEDQQ